MPDAQHKNQSEHEFRIGVLRILDHLREHSDDQPGGASGQVLWEILDPSDLRDLEMSLKWLIDNGYVEKGVRKFLITESGQEYLRKNMP